MAKPQSILITDVGSTTTKAILIEKTEGEYRLTGQANAPTTVEAPLEDVMIGLQEALGHLARVTGRSFLEDGQLIIPQQGTKGVDLYLSTSSAGGGLQMLVAGLMKVLTAESAHRAALGAGAIVMDVLALDDGRLVVERIKRIRELRPDMILLSGGTDDGNISQVAGMAEYIAAAEPQPRLGEDFQVPLVYAGNVQARDYVEKVLSRQVSVHHSNNLRPTLEQEVLEPARREIHRLYLEHVMSHAPGYRQLLEWTRGQIYPTPLAVGKVLQTVARKRDLNLLAFDIGGATTDAFTVLDGILHRTVSANLGMSYSLGNVLAEARPENILRWLPFDLSERQLRNWNFNKMIRPTTLPETTEELLLEQATAREALRLSLQHHKSLAVTLRGVQQSRSIAEVFKQTPGGQTIVDLKKIQMVIGSGGVVSHAPRRSQAMLVLLDAVEPEGITSLYVDSAFLLPHLGILSDHEPEIALTVLEKDCLIPLGTVIAPAGIPRPGSPLARVKIRFPDGGEGEEEVLSGRLKVVHLPAGQKASVEIVPRRGFDVGAGPGVMIAAQVEGGQVGLVLDGRGRPLVLPTDPQHRQEILWSWFEAMQAFER
ncbi:MAG: glutamate mutase L [Firmicutes bacterium]|nr:glutamate mutase L [Bacillota bacterium]MCL5038541.1 glutamate mutase L [Bacillota bacterium]